MELCKKCLTPKDYPGSDFNSEGICRFCLDHEKKYTGWELNREKNKESFSRLVSWAKGKKRPYDAMVPVCMRGITSGQLSVELDIFLERLNLTRKEFDNFMKNPFRHIKYQKKSLAEKIIHKIRNNSI